MDDCGADLNSDKYEHPLDNLIYTPNNVPGPGVNLSEMDSQLTGCLCSSGSTCLKSQLCQTAHACSQNYSSDKILLESKWDCGGIVECNSQCVCVKECENRLVQFGPRDSLEIFQTNTVVGYGLRTQKFIPKGAFICEYAGEVISTSEAKRRFRETSVSNGMNYIFVLREVMNSSSSTLVETVIDPTFIGNIGRYINHSCLPNSGILPVRVDSFIPKLGIFTKVDITSGEEITFDYSGGKLSPQQEGLEILYRKKCYCKSEACVGFLPYDASLL